MSSTTTTTTTTSKVSPQLVLRPSNERGHADHEWLHTFHTFSFAGYYDSDFTGFGPLRVINEDRVDPGTGFGTHAHREYEIFSYVVSGELEHKDSMGNLEILKRGDVQMTSTGTGIRHSEYNRNAKDEVHFIQIWAKPHTSRLPPSYYTRHFPDEDKRDKLVKVVAPVEETDNVREASGPAPVHSHLALSASILSPSASVVHTYSPSVFPITKSYVHLIQRSGYQPPEKPTLDSSAKVTLKLGDEEVTLREGDGTFVSGVNSGDKLTFSNVGPKDAELLFFELAE